MSAKKKVQKIETAHELGTVIREARRKKGLTQADAAGLMGVGVRFLSELERGKSTVELDRALKVARGLGIVIVAQLQGDEK